MNNDDDVEDIVIEVPKKEEQESSIHTDKSMKEASEEIFVPAPESKKVSARKSVTKDSAKK